MQDPVDKHRLTEGLHLGETQGVEADPQDGGPCCILDLSEDPIPLPLCLIIPEGNASIWSGKTGSWSDSVS